MANLSDWAENALLDWLLGGATPTAPAGRFLALYTAAPSDSGGGTEVTGGSYARQALASSAAASGATSNSGTVTFTSTAAWGTVTHIGIHSAATGGNLLWHGALTASRVMASGDSLVFSPAAITFTLA